MDHTDSAAHRLDDAAVFAQMHPVIVDRVRRHLRALGGPPRGHTVEDVAQHCCLVLTRRASEWRLWDRPQLCALVGRIVELRVIELRRAHRRLSKHIDFSVEAPDVAAPDDPPVVLAPTRERVATAIAALSGEDQRLIVAVYVEGQSFSALAAERGVHPMAVKRRHDALLAKLRDDSV